MQEPDALGGGLRSFATLRGSRNCDVLVVGGGLAGLMTACRMAQKGLRTILIEARQLGCGATSACMGTATAQLGEAYATAAHISTGAVRSWAQMMQQAVVQIPELLASWNVNCGLRRQKSVLYAVHEAEQKRLEALVELQERLCLPIYHDKDTGDCPLPVRMAASLDDQLAFEPLALFTGLIEAALNLGVAIYEHTPVRAIAADAVRTDDGAVSAKHIVLATGWPVGMEYPYQLGLLKQQVWVVQRLTGGAPCHNAYMRLKGSPQRLAATRYGLMASGCAGQSGLRKTEHQYDAVRCACASQLKDWTPLQEAAVQAVHATGGLPLVGPLRRNDPRLLVIGGFGTAGIVHAVIGSDLLVRQITGRQLPESQLFVPFGAFQQRAAMQTNRHFYGFQRVAAVFRRSVPMCPHMGCRMRWNTTRRLWECPCHGSVFTDTGSCRTAPAMETAHIPEHLRRR